MAVVGSGNIPSIDEGPRVVAPVVLGHVATTTEEEGRVVLVLRGQRKHGNPSRGGVYSNDTIGDVGEAILVEGVGIPKHGGNVGLDEHISGGHHEGVSVRVETGGINHELHDPCSARGWEELDSGLSGTSLGGWVGVGVVSVDIATVDEATNKSDSPIGKGFSG